MIDENLIFVSLLTIFIVFIVYKQPALIGIIILIIIFYYFYKSRFTNPKDFFSFITNNFKETFEPCSASSGNLAYCGNDLSISNQSFLPNNMRSLDPNISDSLQLKLEDYKIDKRINFGKYDILFNDIVKAVPPIINHKIYLDKIIKFTLGINTDDNIQKDFLASKLCNKMTKIVYTSYNTITTKDYPINIYNDLLYAQREFNDTLNIFVFLGMNDKDSKKLEEYQLEFKDLNDKLNEFVTEKVNNLSPNDYNITTSFLPQKDEPKGISIFDNYINY